MVNYTAEIRFMVQTLREAERRYVHLASFSRVGPHISVLFSIWTRCYLDFKERFMAFIGEI